MQPEKQVSLCDEKGDIDGARRPWEIIPVGHKIGTPVPLFKEMVFLICQISLIDFYLQW